MKRLLVMAVVFAALGLAAWFLAPECSFGGSMTGWTRQCSCAGIERLDYDHRAFDGPRRTLCHGVVTGRSCHRIPGGPEVPCETLPPF